MHFWVKLVKSVRHFLWRCGHMNFQYRLTRIKKERFQKMHDASCIKYHHVVHAPRTWFVLLSISPPFQASPQMANRPIVSEIRQFFVQKNAFDRIHIRWRMDICSTWLWRPWPPEKTWHYQRISRKKSVFYVGWGVWICNRGNKNVYEFDW